MWNCRLSRCSHSSCPPIFVLLQTIYADLLHSLIFQIHFISFPSFAFLIPPSLPLHLSDSPSWCCMHFITFGSTNLKKRRIYANAGLKNECSPQLQCAEESSEAPHYNIFSLLWIRWIIIKNDLWCWNEAEPLLLPANSPNALVAIVDRAGDGDVTSNVSIKQLNKVSWETGRVLFNNNTFIYRVAMWLQGLLWLLLWIDCSHGHGNLRELCNVVIQYNYFVV